MSALPARERVRPAELLADPTLVDAFCSMAAELFDELAAVTTWDAVIADEPELAVYMSDAEFDAALEAIADFVDVKSPYTLGHSRGVAELAEAAARNYGLPADECKRIRRAGLVHDLGRLGVSNAIWEKPGALTPAEFERVRLHPYLTERILASSPTLAPLGALAVEHHERLDGSGYPRGLVGNALSPASRILAVADTYRTRLEPRHRIGPRAPRRTRRLTFDPRRMRADSTAVRSMRRCVRWASASRAAEACRPASLPARSRCCVSWRWGLPTPKSQSVW